jgi:hypothetical protein
METMSTSDGLLCPAFCTLRVTKESRSKDTAPNCGGCRPSLSSPPWQVRCRGIRRDRLGEKTHGRDFRWRAKELSLGKWVVSDMGAQVESMGSRAGSVRMGVPPIFAGHVGLCIPDLVTSRRYESSPGEGEEVPYYVRELAETVVEVSARGL